MSQQTDGPCSVRLRDRRALDRDLPTDDNCRPSTTKLCYTAAQLELRDRANPMAKIVIVSGGSFPIPSKWSAVFKPPPKKDDGLNDLRLKIERANQHIKDVDVAIREFGNSHVIVREMEPDGIHEAIKLRIAPIPEMLPVVIGEAIFQLRSTLDILAWHLAKMAGAKSLDRVYFPIAKSLEIFESKSFQGKIKEFSPEALDFIRGLRPYKGGNDLLWALHDIRNKDTHRHLSAIAFAGFTWTGTIKTLIPADKGVSGEVIVGYPQTFENEIILARCTHGAKADSDTKPVFHIAFDDVEIVEGQPVLAILQQFFDLVQGIVNIADTTFFKTRS